MLFIAYGEQYRVGRFLHFRRNDRQAGRSLAARHVFLPPAANAAEWEDISIWLPALEMIECGAPLLSSDV